MRTVYLINKLQRVQNAAARLVVRVHRWDYITPVFKKLHWPPVTQRIHYAILLLTFRAQHGLAPAYITDLIHEQRTARVLSSVTNSDLYVPPSHSRYGDMPFSVSTPRMRNALPGEMMTISSLVTFKRLVKTPLCLLCVSNAHSVLGELNHIGRVIKGIYFNISHLIGT